MKDLQHIFVDQVQNKFYAFRLDHHAVSLNTFVEVNLMELTVNFLRIPRKSYLLFSLMLINKSTHVATSH